MRANTIGLCILVLLICSTVFAEKGDLILRDDFSGYRTGSVPERHWKPFSGTWTIERGVLTESTDGWDAGIATEAAPTRPFVVEVKTRAADGFVGGGIYFNLQSRDTKANSQMVRLDPDAIIWGHFDSESDYQNMGRAEVSNADGKWHTLKIVASSELKKMHVFFDGRRVVENTDIEYDSGFVGLQSSGGPAEFDDFVIRHADRRDLKDLKIEEPFNHPMGIAVDRDGMMYVSHRGRRAVVVVSPDGEMVRRFGEIGRKEHQLDDPRGIAIDASGNVLVADKTKAAIYIFDPEGMLVHHFGRSAGAPMTAPVDVALDQDGDIYVCDRGMHRVVFFDRLGNFKGVFGDLGARHGEFDAPTSVAIDNDGLLLVGDPNNFRVETFKIDKETWAVEFVCSSPWLLGTKDIAVNSRNERVLFGRLGYYEDGGALRLLDESWQPQSYTGAFCSGAMSQYGAVAVGPDDRVYTVDAQKNRIVVFSPALDKFVPKIEPTGDGLLLEMYPFTAHSGWDTAEGICPYSEGVQYRLCEEGSAWTDAEGAMTEPLQANCRYKVRFPNPLFTIPEEEWTREYTVLAPPPPGAMQVLDKRIICGVFLKVDHSGRKDSFPRRDLGDKFVREFEKCREFYLRNSHFRYNQNVDYVVVDDYWIEEKGVWVEPEDAKRAIQSKLAKNGGPDVMSDHLAQTTEWMVRRFTAGEKDAALPAEIELERNSRGFDHYESVVALYSEGSYEAAKPDVLGDVGGGGLTPFGYSCFGMGGKMGWLMGHEFHHQVDGFFDASGVPRYWLNHPDATIHIGVYGGQWDCNDFILRNWPAWQWFEDSYSAAILVDDADGDGVPDDDARLALDERRLRSDPESPDTDSDGVTDLAEAMAGPFFASDSRSTDTDRDGISDADDAWPTYSCSPEVQRGTPTIDGVIEEDEWHQLREFAPDPSMKFERMAPAVTIEHEKMDRQEGAGWMRGGVFSGLRAGVYWAWDSQYLYFAIDADQPFELGLDIDCWADGWFCGPDNQAIRIDCRPEENPGRIRKGIGLKVACAADGDRRVLELAIPEDGVAAGIASPKDEGHDHFIGPDNGNRGPVLAQGSRFAFSLWLRGEDGRLNWLFDPYREFVAEFALE